MIRSYIRGGNGFIRSSIACHLICIILLNRRSFHKKCPLTKADNISGLRIPQNWLLHFHRKFNLAIPSRFPGSRLIAPLSFSCYGTMDILRFAPLLQWPDRSGFSPDSLFLPAYSCQHLICSLWNYTNIIVPPVTVFVNPLEGFLLFFYQPGVASHGVTSSVIFSWIFSTRIFAVLSYFVFSLQ